MQHAVGHQLAGQQHRHVNVRVKVTGDFPPPVTAYQTQARWLPRRVPAGSGPGPATAARNVAAPFTLIAVGERTVSSGLTGVLIATEPLFILILGWFWGPG